MTPGERTLRVARWVWSHLPGRWDVTVTAGCLLLAVGAWMIYRPAGVLLAGFLLVLVGLVGSAMRAAKERSL